MTTDHYGFDIFYSKKICIEFEFIISFPSYGIKYLTISIFTNLRWWKEISFLVGKGTTGTAWSKLS